MALFHILEDCFVVLRCRGIFRQCKVYERDGKPYAAWGAGYVRLLPEQRTTNPDILWDDLSDSPLLTYVGGLLKISPPKTGA